MLFPASGRNICTGFELLQERKGKHAAKSSLPMGCHCLSTGQGGSDTLVSLLHLMTTGGCFQSNLNYRTVNHAFEQRRKAPVTHHIMHNDISTRGQWQPHGRRTADDSMKQHVMLPTQILEAKFFRIAAAIANPTNWASPSTERLGQPIHRLCLQGTHHTLHCFVQGTSWFHWTGNGQCWDIRVKAALETDLETLYLFH